MAQEGWQAHSKAVQENNPRTPFDAWWDHRHRTECFDHDRHDDKPCFEACWDAALHAAIAVVSENRENKISSMRMPYVVDVAELERLKTS
jgi:hypothetical protein